MNYNLTFVHTHVQYILIYICSATHTPHTTQEHFLEGFGYIFFKIRINTINKTCLLSARCPLLRFKLSLTFLLLHHQTNLTQSPWSFSTCQCCRQHSGLLITVPVRPITSALHKCSLNDKGEHWGLLRLILMCCSVEDTSGLTLMGFWVTSNSFLLPFCPLVRCEENLSEALHTYCVPLGIPWPFSPDRLGHAQFNPSLLRLNTPNPSMAAVGSTCTVKSKVMSRCGLSTFWTACCVFFPTGPCWHWVAV